MQKFNNKNRIHFSFWCVIKNIDHDFFYNISKCFFEFVCFPQLQNSTNGPRNFKNWPKYSNCTQIMQNQETDKLSKKTFRYRKIIHIRIVLIYSELTSHAKSQSRWYIRFNIDTTNNFFWLKSQIFLNFKKFFVK